MKTIDINFEYHIPEKRDAYSEKKTDIIRALVFEKKKMKDYLHSKQEEINNAIDELVAGSNITEAENFLSEVLGEEDDNKFRYIGDKNQEMINDIYMAYREVIKGLNTFEIMNDNNLFSKEEREEIIENSIKADINQLNRILKHYNQSLKLEMEHLLSDKDFYEMDVISIIQKIKTKVSLRVIA